MGTSVYQPLITSPAETVSNSVYEPILSSPAEPVYQPSFISNPIYHPGQTSPPVKENKKSLTGAPKVQQADTATEVSHSPTFQELTSFDLAERTRMNIKDIKQFIDTLAQNYETFPLV